MLPFNIKSFLAIQGVKNPENARQKFGYSVSHLTVAEKKELFDFAITSFSLSPLKGEKKKPWGIQKFDYSIVDENTSTFEINVIHDYIAAYRFKIDPVTSSYVNSWYKSEMKSLKNINYNPEDFKSIQDYREFISQDVETRLEIIMLKLLKEPDSLASLKFDMVMSIGKWYGF